MLPTNEEKWQDMMRKLGYTQPNQRLTSIRMMSASKMDLSQFLFLRVLWKIRLPANQLWADLTNGSLSIANGALSKAKNFLENLASWNKYLSQIRTKPSASFPASHNPLTNALDAAAVESTFALVLLYQRKSFGMDEAPPPGEDLNKVVMGKSPVRQPSIFQDPQTPTPSRPSNPSSINLRDEFASGDEGMELDNVQENKEVSLAKSIETMNHTETPQTTVSQRFGESSPRSPLSGPKAKDYKAVEDEQIVNSALILFLQSLSLHYPSVPGEWSLYRQAFTLTDPSNSDSKVYEARVDGVFRDATSGLPKMIVEVKPYLRRSTLGVYDKIRIQEGAQIAAWVGTHPPPPQASSTSKQYR